MKEELNVVFLDIDGVLQPYDSDCRLDNPDKDLVNVLSQKYNIDYTQYYWADVLAAYLDWHKNAITRLRTILDETSSKIIISSDWREEIHPYKMRDLLKIHNLDNYWIADTFICKKFIYYPQRRAIEINEAIKRFSINNFVVLDDMKGLIDYFPNNMVKTHNYLKEKDVKKALKILKK